MTARSAQLSVAVQNDVVVFRVLGRANFSLSADFKTAAEALRAKGYRRFVVELSGCGMMDSTFIGVLAGLNRRLQAGEGGGERVELLDPDDCVLHGIENIGILPLFKVTKGDSENGPAFEAVESSQASKEEMVRVSLQAHRELMRENDENVLKFRDVVQFLEEDLKRLEDRETS